MLNIQNAKTLLQDFHFKSLFIEELGWSNPTNRNSISFATKVGQFSRKAIAELSGAIAYEIYADDGEIPDANIRAAISTEMQKLNHEHILIFIDKERTQTIWRWLKKQDKKTLGREHFFSTGQSGDLFISKLAGLFVDISEIENDITITDVAKKMKAALDIEKVTKKFFKQYQDQYVLFLALIEGIENESDRRWYASVILNRLMFIYFLQKKMFLDGGNANYLNDKLIYSQQQLGDNQFYATFLEKLFFEGFAKDEKSRSIETQRLIGNIKYLNGGLFLKHKIEIQYKNRIKIPDIAFQNLFDLFDSFSWTLNDTPGGDDDQINPDVLGYIFEKYINQKAFGAYYTRTEITEYLCEQTVYKLMLDEINPPDIDPELLKKAGLAKNTAKRFESISELLLKLDAPICKKLIMGDKAILANLSLLDPACGSGAFLVAAMKTLINVYAAVLGKIDFLHDRELNEWKKKIVKDHPNINYYIKKQIITHNLYGVDIMEEATEIAKLRLFLALVASAETVEQLEPLPNIDFNIMAGNSLIGMMRVDENQFNKQLALKASKKPTKGKVIQADNLFRPGLIQTDIFAQEHTKSYQQLIHEKEAAILSYKNAHELGITDTQALRDSIQESENKANEILHNLLLVEFNTLNIKYEEAVWDEKQQKEAKPLKRAVEIADIQALQPFHWGYEFSEIFRKKNGFDAIITNPPWEVFKPNAKEFFQEIEAAEKTKQENAKEKNTPNTETEKEKEKEKEDISKKKMGIKDFEKRQAELLEKPEIKKAWADYLSRFPYTSAYYRSALQYQNQISIVNGKKAGTDINLYKLFTEQCYNLLKNGGYCGIVIPSAIYAGLGTMQLRKMLFENSRISQLISLSNEKFIFENVHHAFKFCFLSFEKGGKTDDFNAIFRIDPREAIAPTELDTLFATKDEYIKLSPELITKLSPDSLSVMEFHGEIDKIIVNKMVKFPPLGENINDTWNLKIGSEFHMTGDSYLFKSKSDTHTIPLYEGKMIHQFEHNTALAKYFIDEKEGRKAIIGQRRTDKGQILPYQTYRLGFRAIAGNTNIRTIIVGSIPKNVFCGNSLLVSEGIEGNDLLSAQAFLNSFVVDFYARQMVTTNINMFYIYQLPVPRLSPADKWYRPIVERAAKLICSSPEYADLWAEVMGAQGEKGLQGSAGFENPPNLNEAERNELRAELDGIIAHIYGLTEAEFAYILSTFPLVKAAQKEKTLAAFAQIQTQAIVPPYIQVIIAGESPQTEFKSTLRVDMKSKKPEKYIEHAVLKTIAGFLNSEGGTLFIGVEDDKNILGLVYDFDSFSKPDKLDEFQKHFDNLLGNSFGNAIHACLNIYFPEFEGKKIGVIEVKKSAVPIYLKSEKGEQFYIRRLASTIELGLSEAHKYIQAQW